jgi:aspartate racemase
MNLKPAIGVIGGLGPQASVLLYRLLIDRTPLHTRLRDTSDYPRVVLLSTSLPNKLQNGEITDPGVLAGIVALLQAEVRLLEQCGAVVNAIACNTAHLALPQLQSVTGVPFLSIPALMRAHAAKFQRPGYLSTKLTRDTGLYDGVHPRLHRPGDDETQRAEDYIFRLLGGGITDADRRDFRAFAEEYRAKNNLDAVILACTELPVIYGDTQDAEAIVSTLDVLADGLLRHYYKQTAPNA